MPSAAVDVAFRAKLASGWSTGPVIGPEGVTEPPTGTDSFLVLQYPVANADKPVLHGKYFEEGAARLVLNVRRGLEMTDGLGWADALAALFREYKAGSFETFVPSPPIINDTNDNGNWFELAVLVPYRYQFT